jgi:ABC-type Fe3+-siderophore transport system permease subunit
MKAQSWLPLLWMSLLLGVLVVASLFLGSVRLDLSAVNLPYTADYQIFWHIRMPRALVVSLTGALLAVVGVLLQALFRNDLCSPFTLGIAATAGLGVHIGTLFFSALQVPIISSFSLFGVLGAALSTGLTLAFAQRVSEPARLLLIGICLNFFAASLTLALQYLADPGDLFVIQRWLMGSFQGVTYNTAVILGGATSLLLAVGIRCHRALDLLLFGDEFSTSRGIQPHKLRIGILFIICIALSLSVASTGPISFIGLLSPHLARLFTGELHKKLVPLSSVIGAALLLMSDIIARVIVSPFELPPGIVTALIGVPSFIALLCRRAAPRASSALS